MAFYKFDTTPFKLMRQSKFRSALANVQLAERISLIINPVCQQYGLGVPITGAQCFIEQKMVRQPDENPYEVDPAEDPLHGYVNELHLTVLLPNTACLSKFRQIKPSIEKALQNHGIVTLKVFGKVEPAAYRDLKLGAGGSPR